MHILLDVLVSLLGVTLVLSDRAPYTFNDQGVKLVSVQRFKGNLERCDEGEVCADVFNFTRTLDDGSKQPETRFIQNCYCDPEHYLPCASEDADPLIFRETKTQSMMTCEPRESFTVCGDHDVAKEQHNLGNYVFYKINCVCPNNENPRGFFNKMTVRSYGHGYGGPGMRLFKCRKMY